MFTVHIFSSHIVGLFGLFLLYLAGLGAFWIANAVTSWLTDRFEWDRPAWRPWTWRAYRRWYAPGQLIESDDFPLGCVLAIDRGESHTSGDVLDTWLFVQPFPADDGHDERPCWMPLADVIPAPDGPFADDLPLTTHDRAA